MIRLCPCRVLFDPVDRLTGEPGRVRYGTYVRPLRKHVSHALKLVAGEAGLTATVDATLLREVDPSPLGYSRGLSLSLAVAAMNPMRASLTAC